MTCPQCEGIEAIFDEESIRKELLFYEKDGPEDTSQWLIDALKAEDVQGKRLLDIGGGIGAIQHELLEHGMAGAVHVDGSSAYVEGAKQAAEKRGLTEKIEWHHGDFVKIAKKLANAEVVTLDRVICCYDDMPALLQSSLELADNFYGLVYPRDTWYTQIGFRIINLVQRIFGHPFRVFVHSSEEVNQLIAKAGFTERFRRQNLVWQVLLFAK